MTIQIETEKLELFIQKVLDKCWIIRNVIFDSNLYVINYVESNRFICKKLEKKNIDDVKKTIETIYFKKKSNGYKN